MNFSTTTTLTNPSGYVLLLHGLNLNPAKMLPLATALEGMGLSVEPVALSGHRAGTDWSKVTRQEWLSEIKTAYMTLKTKAEQNHAPLFLVAYSLGAVLAVDLQAQDSEVRFDRAILLSPALEVHDYSYVLDALTLFPSLKIPSASPKEYRYHDSTSMAAYKALFQSIKAIHQADLGAVNIPTTVIMDPKDELVSLSKLQGLIQRKNLSQWQLMMVTNAGSSLKRKYHHLIIDSAAVGEAQWKTILEAIQIGLLPRSFE